MKKFFGILLVLLISFGTYAVQNYNFKVTNKTEKPSQPLYIIVGSKSAAPENKPSSEVSMIPANSTFSKDVSLKDYPEFILSTRDLRKDQFIGSEVFSFEIMPGPKTKQIQLDVVSKTTLFDPNIEVKPTVQKGWFGKNVIPSNVTANEIQSSTIIYKPKKIVTNPYQFLQSHYEKVRNYTVPEILNEQSSPFELLGFKPNEKLTKKNIIDRYDEIKKSIQYLEKQPDQKPLYDQALNIINNAKYAVEKLSIGSK